jgi:tRNA dimethylallyltransferase
MMDLKEHILVILGPTATGKTRLAVQLAYKLNAEIISADSRQVYKNMDIGTGKDLSEYHVGDQIIPYHLIDIAEAGEKYNLAQFKADFDQACRKIRSKNKNIIVCGGTGLYLQSVILGFNNIVVPENPVLRTELAQKEKQELIKILCEISPKNNYDISTHKRLIRAIEIEKFKLNKPDLVIENNPMYKFLVLGLNPETETRRKKISERLSLRLIHQELVKEVENLLSMGLSHDDLQYYGLEYKHISYYILGIWSFEEMHKKLETEIHRFAKRQMTFFRSMEKNGINIEWLPDLDEPNRLNFVLGRLNYEVFNQ